MKTFDAVSRLKIPGGRTLIVTPVFDTYWRFAVARQDLFMRRVSGMAHPWTSDPILATYRFTNAYRAADRVSQYLIRSVIYSEEWPIEDTVFRTLLFKFFNNINTWTRLNMRLGPITWRSFSFERYASALDDIMASGEAVYSAAYIMPSPPFGDPRKHRNHLRLLETMMADGLIRRIESAPSLKSLYHVLRRYPSLGDFLAFQFAIDLNYSAFMTFSEMECVVAGPGARNGIRKCFYDTGGLAEAELIHVMADIAEREFARRDLNFATLWGRPLQLIDYQNLFCEVDKYSRIAHPDCTPPGGRTRIKQKFTPREQPLLQYYPPKWHLQIPDTCWNTTTSEPRPPTLPQQLALNLRTATDPQT